MLSLRGIEILWLMGVWRTSRTLAEKCCFGNNLISEYNKAMSDWKKEDVIGSPFAIDDYIFNPALGDEDDFLSFKERLNKKGIKLFLDFVSNHFGADSPLIQSHPGVFLQTDKESYLKDPYTFYEYNDEVEIYVAHGRDPFFPPWTDTAQLNFFAEEARDFLIEKLIYITSVADGVRCDMAMLPLNNVFQNTWSGVLNKFGYGKPQEEFWKTAVNKVKLKNPDFIFLAEAYWDLEWNLQQLGFDFTYDKTLTDRLSTDDIVGIKAHLLADKEFQLKSVRFIENHDEQRAAKKFDINKSLAAAVVISTIQGAHFYYDGQFEGKKTKLPVQFGREPAEKISQQVLKFYEVLMEITNEEIFKKGNWQLLYPEPVGNTDNTRENILAWQWRLNNEFRIIVINYSNIISRCRLKLEMDSNQNKILFEDLFTKKFYKRPLDEIKDPGLFVELKGYQSHIFSVNL